MRVFKRYRSIFMVSFVVFILGLNGSISAFDNKKDKTINCDIQHQLCSRNISGGTVNFDIHPKPVKAMEDLTFIVRTKNLVLSGPVMIDLGMPGMKMGPNQVRMELNADGSYQGTGVIVRCPSGKTIWQAIVTLPGIGSVSFIFDVIY